MVPSGIRCEESPSSPVPGARHEIDAGDFDQGRDQTSMCGIVAYIGHRDATPILIEGLKRLECRGCDSAGR